MLLPLQLNNLLEPTAGALVGTSTLTFAPAGTLSGDGALSGTTTLTFSTSGTITDAAGIVVATAATGRSKRRYYSVEVEGEIFVFTTVADVEAFLATVRREAEEQADRLVTTPVVPKPPKIRVKTAKGKASTSKTVQEAVKRTQKAVTRAYVRAAKRREVDAEISRLITAKLEREAVDEDNIIALLL